MFPAILAPAASIILSAGNILQHIQHMDGKATGWRFYEIRSEVQEHMGSFWR